MSYNITDIIDKAIDISRKRKDIYRKIGKDSNNDCVKVFSNILIINVDRAISYYEIFKIQVTNNFMEEIGTDLYDTISFLIDDFNNRTYIIEINNIKEFLQFSIDFEKDINSLFIDIQGRLEKSLPGMNTKLHTTLCEMLKSRENHIKSLELLSKYE